MMHKEYKFECPGGEIKYEIHDNEAVISGFRGKIFEVIVPEKLTDDDKNSYPVTKIVKKALFGAKGLKRISLPETVKHIDDWALASCPLLEEIFAGNNVTFGQGCFTKDTSLQRIVIKGREESGELLALSATLMECEYLLKEDSFFFEQFDSAVKSILSESDEEGFVFMVLCGEEDLTADIDEYKEMRRKRKAEIVFKRLIHDLQLSDSFRNELVSFLKNHTCGQESEAAFSVLLDHSEDEEYVKLFFDVPMVDDDNFEKVLSSLSDRYAPLKAKVLSRNEEIKKDNKDSRVDSFFDAFTL